MTRTSVLLALLAVVAAGCSDDGGTTVSAGSPPVVAASSSTPSLEPTQLSQSRAPGVPTAEQQQELLVHLETVDAGLTKNTDRAVRRSMNVCEDIRQRKPSPIVLRNAIGRFEGGTVPHLTQQQGAQIVQAVRSTFCH